MPSAITKCVVWDLDDTLWDGVLLEDRDVALRPEVPKIIHELDRRGILNSIASRNDHDAAMAQMSAFGLAEYFLYPQIGWSAKSASIRAIAGALNIGTDAIAFVDDEIVERDEVVFELPDVLCIDSRAVGTMLDRPELSPRFVTPDSARRRLMYQAESVRRRAETEFTGPREEFLATLGMRLEIAPAGEADLQRAEELTIRTNQLNTTGHTYSYDELDDFRRSTEHLLLVARLDDRHGPYGTIGLVLVDTADTHWTIRLLLMSCRVMSRGVGTVLINHVKRLASRAGVRLLAEFVPNERNRMMYTAYKFSQFAEIRRDPNHVLLEANLGGIPPNPPYLTVVTS
ncbi:MAG TPA: HAD-IIIC family phosphatase [Amycolatopsis sp.]|jgi:FkbH-like protein|nr:HAD-IIIC family phosphatase [Amycolatopsis sp.]